MTARLHMLLSAAALAALPVPVLGDEPAPLARLRIATWDFSDAVAAGALRREEPKKAIWRTTFGAERYTPAKPGFDPTKLDTDVLLLQGVTGIREARQFFPAKEWRLIFSRQVLARTQEGAAPSPPTTAIAVRYQKGLRVAGQEHFEPMADAAAGLAVRVLSQGRTVWVASAALNDKCTSAPKDCAAAWQLAKWRQDKAAAGANVVVVGGRISAPAGAKPQSKPAAAAAPPVAVQAPPPSPPPATTQPPKAEAAPKTTIFGWLMGWDAAPATEPQAPKVVATPAPSPPKKVSPPAKQPEAAPPPPDVVLPFPGAVARGIEKDGEALRLSPEAGAPCGQVSLVADFDKSGYARPPKHGFYMEKAGCLAFLDLAIEPAPPPPPTSWPEAVEPAGSGADPDVAADDAG